MPEAKAADAVVVPVKPFDFKVLLKKAALVNAPLVLDFTAEGCVASPNTFLKILGGVIVASKPAIMAELAKI